MNVSFIGLGIMGSRMASNLLKENVDLTVWNRTIEKATELDSIGAKIVNTTEEAVTDADIVFTMLSTPNAVEEVAIDLVDGFIGYMKENAIWVDCSTVNPEFSVLCSEIARDADIRFIDAPVAGSLVPAEIGELVFLAGGADNDIDEVQDLLNIMGKKTIRCGENGKGTAMKLLVNSMLGASMAIFAETAKFGKALGFDEDFLLDTLPGFPVIAPFLKPKSEKIKSDDFSPEFPLEWMHKDLHLASNSAYENNVSIPNINLVKELFQNAKTMGLGREDLSAIYKSMK